MAAFAFNGSVYPTFPNDFDIDVDTITGTSAGGAYTNGSALTLSGEAEYIRDASGTDCSPDACLIVPNLTFNITTAGFTLTGENTENTGNITYMAGRVVPGSFVNGGGGEYGELFTVTADDFTELSALELEGATVLGTKPATDLITETVFFDFDGSVGGDDGDMEQLVAAPEPTTLTLLGTGLAAGLLRRRRARKKA
jgi:hypothetical protein